MLKSTASVVAATSARAEEYLQERTQYNASHGLDKLPPESPSAAQVIAEFTTKVSVIGYASTPHSAAYDLRLAKRRAEAVAAALTRLGVPTKIVTVSWKAKVHPDVQAADDAARPGENVVIVHLQ